eukprot:jgi/Chlat1/8822/Chrsp91S08159
MAAAAAVAGAAAVQLPRRPLGSTGLQVSVLGFGGSPLGGVFGDVAEEDGVRAVHDAIAAGINYFDTSPFYGQTKAESALGRALKSIPRDKYILATKCGRYGASDFDFSAETVTRTAHESLARLQVDYVDVMQVHDIEFGDLDQVVNETLPALQRLKQEGKARFIGITGLPLKVYRYVLDRVEPGSVDMILSYCHNTLFDTSLIDLVPYLKEKNVGIVNASPLCMGLLTPNPPDWHPAPKELKEVCPRAVKLVQDRGQDMVALALRESMRSPDVATTLVGMRHPDEVRRNVQSALDGLSLDSRARDKGILEELEEMFRPVRNMSWPSGLPENN